MQGECETIVKGFKEAGIVEIIKYSEAIYERVKNPRRSPFFFRRLCKYCFMFEEKNMDNKVDVLVQLISCRNLFYNPFLTSLLFLFSLFRKNSFEK